MKREIRNEMRIKNMKINRFRTLYILLVKGILNDKAGTCVVKKHS